MQTKEHCKSESAALRNSAAFIEPNPALPVATAIVTAGYRAAPTFSEEILAFAGRVGVTTDNEGPASLNLFVLDELIRFGSSVVGQAILERISERVSTVTEQNQESFNAYAGKSK